MRAQDDAAASVSSPCCPYCGAPAREQLGGLEWESPGPGRPGKPPRRRRWFRRVRRFFAIVVVLGLLGGVMLAALLIVSPSVANAPALARAWDTAHHASYPGPPVPGRFASALVATEDHRFYTEAGIDPVAIARVGVGDLLGKPDQGGATLYQQLARLLYVPGHVGVLGTAEQALLGIKLDLSYPKSEILRMYADVAYFGHGYYGLNAASCGYFGVHPAALTWPQAAVLAGLVQAPSAYDPFAHLARARARGQHVLARLVATGTLTQAQAARAYQMPLRLAAGRGTGCAAAPH
jgi:membrane peptidoglycan carboxypeptidase